MNNSLKWLISDIIGYAAEGNDIIVKTPITTISARKVGPFMSWVAIYKKKKINLISEIGETDIIFHSITSHINDIDMEDNDANNS